MDAITDVPRPVNEPVHEYAPHGSRTHPARHRARPTGRHDPIDLPHVIGGNAPDGRRRPAPTWSSRTGTPPSWAPSPTPNTSDATAAIEAAVAAKDDWEATPFDERAAVFLRAADLLAGPWREKVCAPRPCSASRSRPTRPRSTRPAN